MKSNLFTSTYIVLLIDENDNFVKFSDFKSLKDLKRFLKKNHLTYDAGEGCFISTNDDRSSYIYICEKAYYEKRDILQIGIIRGCRPIFMITHLMDSLGVRIAKVRGMYVATTRIQRMKIWQKFSTT